MIINKTLKALLKNNPKDPKEPLSDGTRPKPSSVAEWPSPSKLLTPWLVAADFILRYMQPQIPMPWIFWNAEPAEPQLDSVRHISWTRWTLHLQQNFWRRKCSPACSSLFIHQAESPQNWRKDAGSAFQAEQQTKLEMTAPMMIPTVGSSSQFSMQALAEDLNAQNLEINLYLREVTVCFIRVTYFCLALLSHKNQSD